MLYNLLTIFGIGLVIFVHELGHYWAARYVGIRVEAFSIGFGPRLFGWKRGTVDWKFCLIPLGGYVKMAGEDPTNPTTGRDDEFGSKTVGQRILVISAGVIMNMIFALIAIPIALQIGVPFIAPIVGAVVPNDPAFEAGLRTGDRILEVDGTPVLGFNDVRQDIMTGDETVTLKIERDGQVMDITTKPVDAGRGLYQIGMSPCTTSWTVPTAADLEMPETEWLKDSVLSHYKSAGLQGGEKIIAVDGLPLHLYGVVGARPSTGEGEDSVRLTIQGQDGAANREVTLQRISKTPPSELDGVAKAAGIACYTCQIDRLLDGAPQGAKDLLRSGDILLTVDGHTVLQYGQLARALGGGEPILATQFAEAHRFEEPNVNFELIREGVVEDIVIALPTASDRRALLRSLLYARSPKPFVMPRPGSPAERAGFAAADLLTNVNGIPVQTFKNVIEVLSSHREGERSKSEVPFTVRSLRPTTRMKVAGSSVRPTDRVLSVDGAAHTGDSHPDLTENAMVTIERERSTETLTVALAVLPVDITLSGLAQETLREKYTAPFLDSFGIGVIQAKRMIGRIGATLSSIFRGRVDSKHLGGIITIFRASKIQHQVSFTMGLWFLAMISVNLAFLNILPIPVLDGGWLMFLIIERIKGSPVGEKTMAIAQWTGLFMVLSLMVYVTFNDLRRLFGWD